MESWDHTIVWSIATLVVFAFRRVWAKKWYYFVVAGIIFFTPMFTYYPGVTGYYSVWPLIGALPMYLVYWDELHRWWGYVVIPGSVVGTIFWAIAVWRKI
jgi:hypothetical protein